MIQECRTIIVENPKLPLIDIEKSLITTYKKEIFRPFTKAINEYNLIEPGDKIAVGISGGKDSLILAKLFQELKRHNKIPFEVVFLS
ncbi:MAG: tRNA 2-thiocytidine biosynthesis protein TtcA, partial [Acholeplasmataceae bacterium]